MRFRAEQHLRRPSEIRAVREQGKRLECRAFTVWWKPRAAQPTAPEQAPSVAEQASAGPRVCVIASTNAIGNAVRRNFAKRRLREVFRHEQESLPRDCDLLLIARRAVTDSPMPELRRNFVDVCQRMSPPRP